MPVDRERRHDSEAKAMAVRVDSDQIDPAKQPPVGKLLDAAMVAAERDTNVTDDARVAAARTLVSAVGEKFAWMPSLEFAGDAVVMANQNTGDAEADVANHIGLDPNSAMAKFILLLSSIRSEEAELATLVQQDSPDVAVLEKKLNSLVYSMHAAMMLRWAALEESVKQGNSDRPEVKAASRFLGDGDLDDLYARAFAAQQGRIM